MPGYTELMSEHLPVVAVLHSQLVNAGSRYSDIVDLATRRRVFFVLDVGDTDTTVDAHLDEFTSPGGAGRHTLAGKSITQLAATDDNSVVVLEVSAEELSKGYRAVQLVVTVGSGSTGAYVCAVGLADVSRYRPDRDDVSQVVEVVT